MTMEWHVVFFFILHGMPDVSPMNETNHDSLPDETNHDSLPDETNHDSLPDTNYDYLYPPYQEPAYCPPLWIYFAMSCHKHVNVFMTWTEARNYCRKINSNLMFISDAYISYDEPDLTGQWVGLHLYKGKLWWDAWFPEEAKPNATGYTWSERPSNLPPNSYGIVHRFVKGGQDAPQLALKMVSDDKLRTFTCVRQTGNYQPLQRNGIKCRTSWQSSEDLQYCVSDLMEKETFEGAERICKDLNATLWYPLGDDDELIISQYLYGFYFNGPIYVGRDHDSKLPTRQRINFSDCLVFKSPNYTNVNCSSKQQFLCKELSKYSPTQPKVEIIIGEHSSIGVSKGLLKLNSSAAYFTLLNCSLHPMLVIKDDIIEYMPAAAHLTSFALHRSGNLGLAQGTYRCAAKLDNFGFRESNQITVFFNDFITTWIYFVTEVDAMDDFSLYVVRPRKAFSLDMPNIPILMNETVFFFFDSFVKNRQENERQEKNLIKLKFGLYTQFNNSPVLMYFRQPEMPGATKIQLKYLDEYMKAVETNIVLRVKDRMYDALGYYLKYFFLSETLSRRKRDNRFRVKKEKRYANSYVKSTWSCSSVSLQTTEGPIRFEATLAGQLANSTSICPNSAMTPLALGMCNGSFSEGYSWEIVTFHKCHPNAKSLSEITDELSDILNNMDTSVKSSTVKQVEQITSTKYSSMTATDVRLVAEIVQSASKSLDVVDYENGQTLINIVSNTMQVFLDAPSNTQVENEIIIDSKLRLTKSLESVLTYASTKSPQTTWSAENLVVRIDQSKEEMISFGLAEPTIGIDNFVEGVEVSRRSELEVGIVIPTHALEAETKNKGGSKTTIIFYKSSTFFRDPHCQNEDGGTTPIKSFVISASLNEISVSNLSEKIRLRFKIDKDTKHPNCTFLNEGTNTGKWSWSTKGLTLEHFDNETGMIECSSDHLTNFAVIAGFCMHPKSRIAKILTYISIFGMVLSITCLSLVILCQLFFKKFRKGQFQVALLNLSIALIAVNLLVIAGVDRTENQISCIVVAALLHYFLLVAFSMMLIEAILQYYKFVKVFNIHVSKFALKAILPAWIVPALIVGITAAIDYNLFRGPKHYCWLAKDAFHFAFLLPLGLVITANVIVFIRIIKGISCDRPEGMQTNQTKARLVWLQVQVAICCFVVIGLTWSFALFAFGAATLGMQFLFAIFNSFQGFFVFLLFNLREKQVRKAWFDLFCKRRKDGKQLPSSESGGFTSRNNRKNKTTDEVLFLSASSKKNQFT